jgi:hypothetical protein
MIETVPLWERHGPEEEEGVEQVRPQRRAGRRDRSGREAK